MTIAMQTVHLVAVIAGLLLGAPVFAQFEFVPAPAPYTARSHAVSSDGTIVAGSFAVSPGTGLQNYAFVFQDGIASGIPGGGGSWYHSGANSMSADGRTLVGNLSDQFWTQQYPYRQRLGIDAAPVSLGRLDGYTRGYSNDVSGDGSVVVGYCDVGRDTYVNGQAFRWTESGGMQALGFTRPGHSLSDATAISRDGNVIVGLSAPPSGGYPQAFRWTASTGIQELPSLSAALGATAMDCSADGRVIVGSSFDPITLRSRPVRWDDGVLSTLPQFENSGLFDWITPSTISSDGSIIGGDAILANTNIYHAVVWIGREHPVLLSDYLAEFGIFVPTGWRLTLVGGISDDGRTFVGTARDASGFERAYVVTVPAPGPAILALLVISRPRRRRANQPLRTALR